MRSNLMVASKDETMVGTSVEILCPNGHRQTVKTTPNIKFVQILEEVCSKKGFQPPSDYQLKHGRKVLDLTLPLRFSGLPNHAKLELVAADPETAAKEEPVVVALQLPNGERLQREFMPAITLWEVMKHWEQEKGENYACHLTQPAEGNHIVIIYIQEEVIGDFAIKNTTLKGLGLLRGKALLRVTHRPVDDSVLENIQKELEKKQKRLARSSSSSSQQSMTSSSSGISQSKCDSSTNVAPSNQPIVSHSTSSNVDAGVVSPMEVDSVSSHNLPGATPSASSRNTGPVPMDISDTSLATNSASDTNKTSDTHTPPEHIVSEPSLPNDFSSEGSSNVINKPLGDEPKPTKKKPKKPPSHASSEEQRMSRLLPGMHFGPSSQLSDPTPPAAAGPSHHRAYPPMVPVAMLIEFKFPEETKGQSLYKNELSCVQKEDFKPCDRETVVYSLDSVIVDQEAMQDPSEDFFEITQSDFNKMYASVVAQQQEEAPLMTLAMRQAQKEEKMERYPRAVIRVHFPDRHILQGVFRPQETVFALYKFVKEHLEDKSSSFYLYTTPPRRVLKEKSDSLFEVDLTPLCVVYYGEEQKKDTYLSKGTLTKLEDEVSAQRVVSNHFKADLSKQSSSTSGGGGPATSSAKRIGATGGSSGGASKGEDGKPKVPKWFKMGHK